MGDIPRVLIAFVVVVGLLGLALLTFIAVRVDAIGRQRRAPAPTPPEPEAPPAPPELPPAPAEPIGGPCPDCPCDPHKIWNRQRDHRGVDVVTEEPVNPLFLLFPPPPPS